MNNYHTFIYFFILSVSVLERIRRIHNVYKATKRPKIGMGTQKPETVPYKEPN